MYEIEKNHPPPTCTGPGRKAKYPFSDMEVGDSFVIEDYTTDKLRNVLSTANYYILRHEECEGWKFTARKTEDNNIRIWRIK